MPANKQLKITIDPKIAETFKAACVASGISMTAELSAFMSDRAGILNALTDKRLKHDSLDTRGKRRRQVNLIIDRLVSIKSFEESYRSRIPESLQSGQAYEDSDLSIEMLEQAIDSLHEAY